LSKTEYILFYFSNFINDHTEFFIKKPPNQPVCPQSKVGPKDFTNPKVGPLIKNYESVGI
jgi:hypothetical protein